MSPSIIIPSAGILSPDSYFNITVTTDMLSEECKNILMKYEI